MNLRKHNKMCDRLLIVYLSAVFGCAMTYVDDPVVLIAHLFVNLVAMIGGWGLIVVAVLGTPLFVNWLKGN